MPAVSFQVSKSLLVLLAHVVRNVLPTTSTRETRDRWDNVQECLRMASTVAAEFEDKESLNRLALLIFIAWETGAEGHVPDCLDVQDGQVLLRCHVSEHDITDLPRLQACRELRCEELDAAERDLACLVSHCREADFGQCLAVDDLHRSQNALAAAVDALNAEPEEHMIQA